MDSGLPTKKYTADALNEAVAHFDKLSAHEGKGRSSLGLLLQSIVEHADKEVLEAVLVDVHREIVVLQEHLVLQGSYQ